MGKERKKIYVSSTQQIDSLKILEAKYRKNINEEVIPFARMTSYVELATTIFPITTGKELEYKYHVIKTKHVVRIGLKMLLLKIRDYLELKKKEYPMDILSISGGSEGNELFAVILIRSKKENGTPDIKSLYDFLGESRAIDENHNELLDRLNVEKAKLIEYSDEEKKRHKAKIIQQKDIYDKATEEKPFLNTIDKYTKIDLPKYNEDKPLLYLLKEKEKSTPTVLRYEDFSNIFAEAMIYITGIERDAYYNVLRGMEKKENFMSIVKEHLVNTYVFERKILPSEDVPVLLKKMETALFELYIVQELIDDPQITDIKITDPYSIRVRIKGKAYLSDITFLNDDDYIRFVNMLIIRNNIDTDVPEQTFTDNNDLNNILRFTITMPYISSNGYPVLHIRKVPRKKMLSNDLIKVGMFDEKIRDYLLDCGKHSTGVVFSGPPGSGKTVALNWFLEEAYEDSAEILVIQENDELFANRSGIIFQHIVNNPVDGQRPCTLEDLGELALVAGANVFVIGEVKGAEICSAITLANSGCRTAITVHSRSSTETIDKMADLALKGTAKNFEQAKRMLKCFQTIVYLEGFKIREISEITGYDEDKKEMIYKPIYRRSIDEEE